MASAKTKPVKLGELLQEQQEPFVLEAYLFERGCLRKSLSSSKSLKRSCSLGQNESKKASPSLSKILRSVYKKLVFKNGGSRTKSSGKEEGKVDAETEITLPRDCLEDSDGLSSSSSRTQYESCRDSDNDEAVAAVSLQNEDQASLAVEGTSRVSNLGNMKVEREIALLNGETSSSKKKKQSKELTSIPLLEDRPSHAVPKKFMEDSTLSSSLWELLFQPPLQKPKGTSGVPEILQPMIRSNPSPHKSKRMLHQTRQLLFDCVREMTETHAKQMKEQNGTKFLGAEQLGKLVSEKLRIWDRVSGDETNIDFLLDSDFDEWNCFEHEKEICCKIGDAILEEIIEESVALPLSLDHLSFQS